MLFNSYAYIFFFLPLVLAVYFIFNRKKLTFASKAWLAVASLVFYGWWNPIYTPLIAGSIAFNYLMGRLVARQQGKGGIFNPKYLLWAGIAGNVALLGYFKYTDFFISNINVIGRLSIPLTHVALPLGISFFTFTQIAYLVDTARGKAHEYNATNYSLFVTFFPHLLAGPIIHHSEMMPQFDRLKNKVADSRNLAEGVCLFFIGLFKKVVIADSFATWANNGYSNTADLTMVTAWVTSLAYSMQLYYDFSGYTDMALGSSLMFNIRLPINFNSPYRSLSIQEFWRRWHITLGRFIRDYVYILLGGNRVTEARALLNIMITFFIVGFWHGAGWTFIIWGCIHGAALVIHRLWQKLDITMPRWLAWLITFNFVNAAFVLFRSTNFVDAGRVLKAMAGFGGAAVPEGLKTRLITLPDFLPALDDLFEGIGRGQVIVPVLLIFLPLSFLFRNSDAIARSFEPNAIQLVAFSLAAVVSILFLGTYSEFLYFRF